MESEIDKIIYRISGDPSYIEFLIVEHDHIKSALEAKGPSLDVEYLQDYPSTIGSALHCDIIELDLWLGELSPNDRELLQRYVIMQDHIPAFGRANIRHCKRLMKGFAERNAASKEDTKKKETRRNPVLSVSTDDRRQQNKA